MAKKLDPTQFQYLKVLGHGAFSRVEKGLYKPENQLYAVKKVSKQAIIQAGKEQGQKMADDAKREARVLLMCDHPNIVKFRGAMQTPDELLYVMELCDGVELHQAVRERTKLPVEAAAHVTGELLEALQYLHCGVKRNAADGVVQTVIHRDIKPENIIIIKDSFHVKLIDFGTARTVDSASTRSEAEEGGGPTQGARGRADTFVGTTHYMSPEILTDNYACAASDLWALGCIVYFMVAGRRPFDGTPYQIIKKITSEPVVYAEDFPPNARELCDLLLNKSADERSKLVSPEGYAKLKALPFFANVNWYNVSYAEVFFKWVPNPPKWMEDAERNACTRCGSFFTLFNRRHHCRCCGELLCVNCTPHEETIAPHGAIESTRVCTLCCERITKWKRCK